MRFEFFDELDSSEAMEYPLKKKSCGYLVFYLRVSGTNFRGLFRDAAVVRVFVVAFEALLVAVVGDGGRRRPRRRLAHHGRRRPWVDAGRLPAQGVPAPEGAHGARAHAGACVPRPVQLVGQLLTVVHVHGHGLLQGFLSLFCNKAKHSPLNPYPLLPP